MTEPAATPVEVSGLTPGGDLDLGHFFNSDVALFSITGSDGYFRRSNAAFERLLGWSERDLMSRSFYELLHPDDIPLALERLAQVETTAQDVSFDARFIHADGNYRWLAWVVQGKPYRDAWYATARDVTEQRELVEALNATQDRLRMAMAMSGSGSWEYDLAEDRLVLDASAQALLGLTTRSGGLSDLLAAVADEDRFKAARLAELPPSATVIDIDFRVGDADGSPRHVALRGKVSASDRRGRPTKALGIAWNITEQKQMEQRLLHLVSNDQLTGLPNRRSIEESLQRAWAAREGSDRQLAVLMIDIDDFKQVNDTWGHQMGDRYLASVASAVASVAGRSDDVVGRYGGEEFLAVLPDCDPSQLPAITSRFVSAVSALGLRHPNGTGVLTVSVGGAVANPAEGGNVDDLVAQADRALYDAKRTGKARGAVRMEPVR